MYYYSFDDRVFISFIGTLTLINYNNSCSSLINTNLWFITICSYILQIINFLFYSYFAIMIIIGELCRIKTPCCCLFNKIENFYKLLFYFFMTEITIKFKIVRIRW